MGGSKFIPIVLAGLVGLIVGWLMGPNVDEVGSEVASVRSALEQRVAALSDEISSQRDAAAEQQNAIADQVGSIQTNVASIGEELARQGEQAGGAASEAVSNLQSSMSDTIGQLQQKMDALSSALEEQTSNVTSELTGRIDDLQTRVASIAEAQTSMTDQLQKAEEQAAQRADRQSESLEALTAGNAASNGQPAASGGDTEEGAGSGDGAGQDLDRVFRDLGESGTVLFVNQAAMLGDTEVTLQQLNADDETATFAVGGETRDVAVGDSLDVSDNCSLGLRGTAGSAVFLSVDGCQAQAGNGPDGQPQSASNGPAGSDVQAGSSDPAALAGEIGSAGAILLPEQAAIFDGNRLSLSAIDPASGTATVTAGEGEEQTVESGASVDVGEGCSVTLAGVAGGAAYFSGSNCGSGSSDSGEAAAGASEQDASDPQGAANAEPGDETNGAAAAQNTQGGDTQQATGGNESAPGSNGGGSGLGVGEAATFGDHRVFVSAIGDGQATIAVIGGAREVVETGSSIDLGEGCSVTLQSIDDGRLTLSPEGCGGDNGAQEGQSGQQSGSTDPSPADEASAQSAGEAAPAGAQSGDQGDDQSSQTDATASDEADGQAAEASGGAASSGNGSQLSVGETGRFGDRSVFVSAIAEDRATLAILGQGRQSVEVGGDFDAGDGCAIRVDSIESGAVTLTPNGC